MVRLVVGGGDGGRENCRLSDRNPFSFGHVDLSACERRDMINWSKIVFHKSNRMAWSGEYE
jgi:hypothetical protein